MDEGDLSDCELRATAALEIYERMGDPWGIVESKLLLAQVALVRNAPDARERVEACEIAGVQEREPMQHWHITQAWLAYREANHEQAIAHLEAAREVMGDHLGDHSKQLFMRLAGWLWPEPLRERVKAACQIATG
jgi:hypothetical protein